MLEQWVMDRTLKDKDLGIDRLGHKKKRILSVFK